MNAKRRSIRAARAGAVLFTLAALAMHANLALADTPTICVTSSSQLESALALAQKSAVSIQLMQSTYDLKGTVWNYNTTGTAANFFAGSSLSGGYLNACSAQNIDRDNTIVTDSSTTPFDAFQILGDATIQGITFHLKGGLAIAADGTSTQGLAAGAQLTLRRNVFTQTIANSHQAIWIIWDATSSSGGTIRLVNNLVYENTSTSDVGAVQLTVDQGKPTIEAINNTIANNGGMMEGMLLQVQSAEPIYAYNNILYGSGGLDLDIVDAGGIASTNVTLTNNTVGRPSYPNTATVTGAKSGDPKLDSSYKPITSPVSPSINTGVSSVSGGLPSTDLPGKPRKIGSEPDRGAYESNVNDLTTHTVTNTNDSGAGSLRDAITQSNTNGVPTTITFNMGNACPYTISPITALPAMTAPITIDGYSPVGATPNDLTVGNDASLCVILDGTAHGLMDGLVVSSAATDETSVTIDGIAFSGFSHGAITLSGGSGHTIWGSRVGGAVGSVSLDPVANGIIIGPGVHDVIIGGDTSNPALMNILGSATGSGIVMDGANGATIASHDNQAIGNYIGVGWSTSTSAFTNRGNGGAGVLIGGTRNRVEANYIEFNGGYGVELTGTDATNATIKSNMIGYLNSFTDTGSGNHGGIVIENGAHDENIDLNAIWFNLGTGVRVLSGVNNLVTGNQIWSNSSLGIDLGTGGVDPNDDDSMEPAGYPNNGLNFPVITGAIGGHSIGEFTGTLTTKPGTYSVEVDASPACDTSGHGQGLAEFAIVQVVVPPAPLGGQATGSFDFKNNPGFDFRPFPVITATAFDANGNTSEFSKCFTYTDDTVFADSFDN
jgi:Right handed beta helix region